ncbi:MAG: GDP-mannose 4,6-dehydratase [Candidatus Levybacteria bacterium]|nr:GDP-mannose 4,6-dehydratase [Candidatus Levybacteria bacterium]
MNCLVAGGAGFIGAHLCHRLLQDGYRVVCIDNFLTGTLDAVRPFISNKNFSYIVHDVTNPLPSGLQADAVFHLASPASPNQHSSISYHAFPMETMLANTRGTLNLLQFAKHCHAKFLFASTSEVYGDPLEHPQIETYRGNVSTIGPRSVYDESKRFGETLTSYFWRDLRQDTRIARIFNTYGPGMRKEDLRMVVSFITQALRGDPITVFGDGKQTRSFCYVDDMIEGLMRLMFYTKTKGQVVNLGTTQEHSVSEYATLIKQLTKSKSEIVFNEALPQDDPMKRKPDITKAKQLLSWKPMVGLEAGLQRTIDYFTKI